MEEFSERRNIRKQARPVVQGNAYGRTRSGHERVRSRGAGGGREDRGGDIAVLLSGNGSKGNREYGNREIGSFFCPISVFPYFRSSSSSHIYHLALIVADRKQKGSMKFSEEQKAVWELLGFTAIKPKR